MICEILKILKFTQCSNLTLQLLRISKTTLLFRKTKMKNIKLNEVKENKSHIKSSFKSTTREDASEFLKATSPSK